MIDGASYTVTVNNLTDSAAAANVIAPNSQASFNASVYLLETIGLPSPAGVQSGHTNGLDLSAGGTGVGSTTDQMQISYISKTGDFDLCARVGSLSPADAW